MRFPTRASLAAVRARVAKAVSTAVRQVPTVASYAVETATALGGQVQQRLGRRRAARGAPSPAAVEAGAPGAAPAVAERVQAERDAAEPMETTEPEQLPIADWDHASMPSLRARVARLSLDELFQLRAYETEHAARLAVLTMLDNRIAKVDRSRADQD
jgi:hypothetical protein